MTRKKIENFKVYNYEDWTLNCRQKSIFCILMNFNINPMILLLDSVCYYKMDNNKLYQESKFMGRSSEERFKEVG